MRGSRSRTSRSRAARISAIAARGVHHRPDVVRLRVERRYDVGRKAVGQAGAAPVEKNDPAESGERLDEADEGRLFPHRFDVVEDAGNDDEVDGRIADDLIRDAEL